ncbi:MAG: hypothetical protein LBR53_02095 [Deltaproteobacteria bacterium]|nr:hypothetical protein [Deltaproteobacteria bacterium]
MRDNPPLMDAELLKLSPRLDTLAAECPGKALKASAGADSPLELDEKRPACAAGSASTSIHLFTGPPPREAICVWSCRDGEKGSERTPSSNP